MQQASKDICCQFTAVVFVFVFVFVFFFFTSVFANRDENESPVNSFSKFDIKRGT